MPTKPARRDFAVLDHPVVGDLKAGLLHFGIFQGKQTQARRSGKAPRR